MTQTFTPQDFARKWRRSTLKERSAVHEHFSDICRLINHPTPPEDDLDGIWYAYEAGAEKTSGGKGWADVYLHERFAWEYKGKNGDLNSAYQQLLQYRESLENPPLLVVSDMERIVVHTNYTNSVKRVETITLDQIASGDGVAKLDAIFRAPDTFRSPRTTEQVTEEAARAFARIAEVLRKYGEDPQRIAHFLIRLLFCLFAEDIGLLPTGIFTELLDRTRGRSDALTHQIRQLFAQMATGGWFGPYEIAHFNGGMFEDDFVLDLDSECHDILRRIAKLDWSSVEPWILGTLFERGLDPTKRGQLGAHYTSKDDIQLIVDPVLMVPLRRRWADIQIQARALMARRDSSMNGQASRLHRELTALLMGFAHEIAQVRVLDPACGSGNFLSWALKELLDLEKQVITFADDCGVGRFIPSVSPEQLYGIEINEYAHELAQASVWISYIQWLRDNGFGKPQEPILKRLDTIKHMDALIAFDADGLPYEPEWPKVDVIVGNPPFLGGNKIRQELGNTYVDTLFRLYDGRVPAFADLVTYWFERARQHIEVGDVQRAGLLATNSIRGGANRKVLERIKQSGDIFMAWSDRPWVLDGAAVRVSMIGFDNNNEQQRTLNGNGESAVNADLSEQANVISATLLCENTKICFRSDEKGGPFDIPAEVALPFIHTPLNSNNRPNTDVIRPYVNGLDVMRRNRGMWVIDFGVDMSLDEAALYELPFTYVQHVVKPVRALVRNEREQGLWWLHRRPAPDMRAAVTNLKRFIATPSVAKHRLFVWLNSATIPDHQLYIFAREDDYFFGVLHSKVHELWSLRLGTRMGVGNDPRYTPTTTFETFPFPWPPGTEPADHPRVAAIATAAQRLVALRDNWLNPLGASEVELKKRTLTNLYNARPSWLAMAHEKLDAAVFDAYGWPHDLTDEQILERLLALNLERAAR